MWAIPCACTFERWHSVQHHAVVSRLRGRRDLVVIEWFVSIVTGTFLWKPWRSYVILNVNTAQMFDLNFDPQMPRFPNPPLRLFPLPPTNTIPLSATTAVIFQPCKRLWLLHDSHTQVLVCCTSFGLSYCREQRAYYRCHSRSVK